MFYILNLFFKEANEKVGDKRATFHKDSTLKTGASGKVLERRHWDPVPHPLKARSRVGSGNVLFVSLYSFF